MIKARTYKCLRIKKKRRKYCKHVQYTHMYRFLKKNQISITGIDSIEKEHMHGGRLVKEIETVGGKD